MSGACGGEPSRRVSYHGGLLGGFAAYDRRKKCVGSTRRNMARTASRSNRIADGMNGQNANTCSHRTLQPCVYFHLVISRTAGRSIPEDAK